MIPLLFGFLLAGCVSSPQGFQDRRYVCSSMCARDGEMEHEPVEVRAATLDRAWQKLQGACKGELQVLQDEAMHEYRPASKARECREGD